jgi:hypothetical protein
LRAERRGRVAAPARRIEHDCPAQGHRRTPRQDGCGRVQFSVKQRKTPTPRGGGGRGHALRHARDAPRPTDGRAYERRCGTLRGRNGVVSNLLRIARHRRHDRPRALRVRRQEVELIRRPPFTSAPLPPRLRANRRKSCSEMSSALASSTALTSARCRSRTCCARHRADRWRTARPSADSAGCRSASRARWSSGTTTSSVSRSSWSLRQLRGAGHRNRSSASTTLSASRCSERPRP